MEPVNTQKPPGTLKPNPNVPHEIPMNTEPQLFLVRGESSELPLPCYADKEDDFSPFAADDGPLHKSRFRCLLKTFGSQAEAEGFMNACKNREPHRFNVLSVEPVAPELMASFQTMEAERRASLQKLLPLVDRVLEVFDFARVQKAMVALDWKYEDDAPPSVEKLKTVAKGLLFSAAEDDGASCMHSSGGFQAWRSGETLYLSFQIESAYAEEGRSARL